MKLFASSLFAVLALGALCSAKEKCKPRDCPGTNCYVDYVGPPNCKPNEPCPAIAIKANICEWTCGQKVPAGCTERCKPCPPDQEVCPEICHCEVVCTEGACAPKSE